VLFSLTGGHGGWSYEGCIVKESRVNETVCSCNHLTSFAVLMVIILKIGQSYPDSREHLSMYYLKQIRIQ